MPAATTKMRSSALDETSGAKSTTAAIQHTFNTTGASDINSDNAAIDVNDGTSALVGPQNAIVLNGRGEPTAPLTKWSGNLCLHLLAHRNVRESSQSDR